MRNESKAERLIAWGMVAGLHLGLFWLLTYTPMARRVDSDPVRMRVVLLPRGVLPASPEVPSARRANPDAPRKALQARIIEPVQTRIDDAPDTPANAVPAPVGRTVDWQQQAREAAVRQEASDAPDFAPDPLRSRRAQLPGGQRRDTFAMRQAVTPADVAGFIGGLFGGYPPPCPRVRENIAGLLTSTSERDRELLQEELRQQREYCAP